MKIAVIPARGGSQRIPRKNIKSFINKPIIAYSIEAALKSELFDHVIVSTDDQEIAEVAKEHGAEVPFIRPVDLSGHHTGTNPVVKHVVEWFEAEKEPLDFVCCIYATAPLLDAQYLKEAYEQLVSSDKNFVFSATCFSFPIQRAIKSDATPFFPEWINERSQDLEEAYHDAGMFYFGKATAYLDGEPLFCEHSEPYILPHYAVQDIDTTADWKRAELYYQVLMEK